MLDVSRSDFTAAVAGAGTMGRGIAQVLAQCGARTLLYDAQPGAAQRGLDSISQALAKLAEKGRVKDPQSIVQRIEVVPGMQAFAPCHLVVEAIVEDLAAKRVLLSELEGIVSESCILASNTSSLSVTAMAAGCKRPGRVAGYHFFNPVPVMKIVEVVDGVLTEPWVTDALTALAQRFGHAPVRCKDTPGFVVNHAGRAFVPEALRVLKELLLDLGAKLELKPASDAVCFVAPLGLDASAAALEQGLDPARTVAVDPLFGFSKRRTLMVTPVTKPEVRNAAHALLASDGVPVSVINDSPGFVAQRVVAHIVNVGCDIVQMRIATPEDLDRAVMLGLGYPKGPLAMGDALGAKRIFNVLHNMHELYQEPRYRPSPWLRRRAQLGVSLLTPEN